MDVKFSTGFEKKLVLVRKRKPALYKKILMRLELFELDKENRLLRLHKLGGRLDGCWAISAENDYRLIFYYLGTGVVFFNLGTHDQVYRNK